MVGVGLAAALVGALEALRTGLAAAAGVGLAIVAACGFTVALFGILGMKRRDMSQVVALAKSMLRADSTAGGA
jgi:hypothetical protein